MRKTRVRRPTLRTTWYPYYREEERVRERSIQFGGRKEKEEGERALDSIRFGGGKEKERRIEKM